MGKRKKLKLSLCMIVKDEEERLGNCLESVRHIVDEIIIVDTGSTDCTVEVAKANGSHVFSFPWNGNFSEARNFSLEKAKGEWILLLDADEAMTPEEVTKLKGFIEQRALQADAYYLKVISFVGKGKDQLVDGRLSLFRNRKEYRFQGWLHEEIQSSILRHGGRIDSLDLTIQHYGYLDEVVRKKGKGQRNRSIIEKKLAEEKDPAERGFLTYALAVEWMLEGDFPRAEELLRQVMKEWTPKHPSFSDAIYKYLKCLHENQKWAEYEETLEIAIFDFPDYTDIYFLAGSLALERKEWNKSITFYLSCILLGEAPYPYYSMAGVGSYRPWHGIGLAYEIQGKWLQALRAYQKSLTCHPGFKEPLLRWLDCLCKLVPDADERISIIKETFDVENEQTLKVIAKERNPKKN